MAIDRHTFLKVLEDSYSAYYNIIPNGDSTGLPLVFRGDYFSREEKYWVSKSIPIYGNETNEHVYLFSAESFDRATAEACVDFALSDGLPRVKPHKEHQYTNIKAIFIADSFEDAALEYLKKKKYSVSYKFSLHGYSHLHTAAVSVPEKTTVTNAAGRDLVKFFKKLFAVRED